MTIPQNGSRYSKMLNATRDFATKKRKSDLEVYLEDLDSGELAAWNFEIDATQYFHRMCRCHNGFRETAHLDHGLGRQILDRIPYYGIR